MKAQGELPPDPTPALADVLDSIRDDLGLRVFDPGIKGVFDLIAKGISNTILVRCRYRLFSRLPLLSIESRCIASDHPRLHYWHLLLAALRMASDVDGILQEWRLDVGRLIALAEVLFPRQVIVLAPKMAWFPALATAYRKTAEAGEISLDRLVRVLFEQSCACMVRR